MKRWRHNYQENAMRIVTVTVLCLAAMVFAGCTTVRGGEMEPVAPPPSRSEFVDTWFGVDPTYGMFAVTVALDEPGRGVLRSGVLAEGRPVEETPIIWRQDEVDPYNAELRSEDGRLLGRLSTSTQAAGARLDLLEGPDAGWSPIRVTREAYVRRVLEP